MQLSNCVGLARIPAKLKGNSSTSTAKTMTSSEHTVEMRRSLFKGWRKSGTLVGTTKLNFALKSSGEPAEHSVPEKKKHLRCIRIGNVQQRHK